MTNIMHLCTHQNSLQPRVHLQQPEREHSLLHRTTCCTVPRRDCTRFCAALAAAL